MQIKIISDGTPFGTEVLDLGSGNALRDVVHIRIDLDLRTLQATAVLTRQHTEEHAARHLAALWPADEKGVSRDEPAR